MSTQVKAVLVSAAAFVVGMIAYDLIKPMVMKASAPRPTDETSNQVVDTTTSEGV